MSELFILNSIIIAWFALAVIVFITLFFFTAPYGRHTRKGWGPATNSRLGWVLKPRFLSDIRNDDNFSGQNPLIDLTLGQLDGPFLQISVAQPQSPHR